jgi:hypothetical protein
MREALGILEQLKASGNTNNTSVQALRPANILLNEKAMAQPSLYLPAVQAMKRITSALNERTEIEMMDIIIVERSFQKILSAPDNLPSAGKAGIKQQLSKQYFINLQHRQP